MKRIVIFVLCVFLIACNSQSGEGTVEDAVNATLTAVAQAQPPALPTETTIPPTPTIAPDPAVSEAEVESIPEGSSDIVTDEGSEPTDQDGRGEPSPSYPTATPASEENAPQPNVPLDAPPTATPDPTQSTHIEGTVSFADGSQPATAVFAIGTDPSFQTWQFVLVNPNTNTFEMEVEAGSYTLVAWATDGSKAAAYINADNTFATITINNNEVIGDVNLTGLLEGECNKVDLAGSPDGRYPAFPAQDGNCDNLGNTIHADGSITLSADNIVTTTNTMALFDLDLSGDPSDTASDIELLIVDNDELAPTYAIKPINNSILINMGAGEPAKSGCESASGYSSESTSSVIIANFICVQTSNGRYSQVRIDALTLIENGKGEATISFTTWE